MNHNFIWLTRKMTGCVILVTVLSASVSTAISQTVSYQETSSMLSKYLRKSDTATMVHPYLRKSDIANMLARYVKLQQAGSSHQQTGKIFVSDSIRTNGVIHGARLGVYGDGTATSLIATNSSTGSAGYFQAAAGRALNAVNVSSALNNPTIYLQNKGTGDVIKAHNNTMEIMSLNNKGALKAKSFLSDTIRSVSANGGVFFTNTGLKVMGWGVGSVNQVIFYGTTGYHTNITSSYTARSFTDKNYVDSSVALRLIKSDTLKMLMHYLRKSDTALMLSGYARLGNIGNSNTKLNISDTSNMLSAYLRKSDTAQLLAGYANKGELNNRMRYVDTASMLSVYARRSELPMVAGHLKYADTVGMLAGYARTAAVQQKMNYTDTSSMLASYLKRSAADQLYASTGAVQMKLNFSDTSSMLSPYLLKADAISNYTSFAQLQNYLPLAGGTLNGTLYGTEARFSGNLYVKKLVVAPTTWSDYVFDKSYKLRSLKEVAQFIQENHHLPDVPSAKEVVDKGISVGENQAVLLRKIEELTLYIIEQNKRIEKLEGKMRNKK